MEGVAVRDLADEHGTPIYIYSKNHMREKYRALADAMADVRPMICYSVKANSNAAVIKTFTGLGSGVDIVSGGELFRALRAGTDPSMIVFAGVGKTEDEITHNANNIYFFLCKKRIHRKAHDYFTSIFCNRKYKAPGFSDRLKPWLYPGPGGLFCF